MRVSGSRVIHREAVYGLDLDFQTRCRHYHSALDIIAIKFKCCGRWFPCFECHAEVAEHDAEIWKSEEFHEKAILCGGCGHQLRIDEYMNCDSVCPSCHAKFNPGCADHYHLYFESH